MLWIHLRVTLIKDREWFRYYCHCKSNYLQCLIAPRAWGVKIPTQGSQVWGHLGMLWLKVSRSWEEGRPWLWLSVPWGWEQGIQAKPCLWSALWSWWLPVYLYPPRKSKPYFLDWELIQMKHKELWTSLFPKYKIKITLLSHKRRVYIIYVCKYTHVYICM